MSLVKDSLQSIKPKFIVFWAAYLLNSPKVKISISVLVIWQCKGELEIFSSKVVLRYYLLIQQFR